MKFFFDIRYMSIIVLGTILLIPLLWYINYIRKYNKTPFSIDNKKNIYALQHIGIIMDGNRRWSKKRHKSYVEGYSVGGEKFLEAIAICLEERVPVITFYALTRDNFEQRTVQELHDLMQAVIKLLKSKKQWFIDRRVAIRVYGEKSIYELQNDARDALRTEAKKLVEEIDEICKETDGGNLLTCNLLVGYHPVDDLLYGVQMIAQKVQNGTLNPQDIDRSIMLSHIRTADIPPIDLIIRSGGVSRTSGFVPMQSLYAEIEILPEMWPDVSTESLRTLIRSFALRTRNFGK